MKLNIITLVVLLNCWGCVKKATIELPKAEKKLFVTCFLSPGDSIIGAVVRQSSPSFGNQDPNSSVTDQDIKDAIVILSDGINSVTLPFDPDLFFYKTRAAIFPIVSGKTYYLSVTTPDGKKVDATTTVPEGQLDIEAFNVNVTRQDTDYVNYNVDILVNDIPNQVNYICVFNQGFISDTDPPGFTAPYSYNLGAFDKDDEISKTKYNFSFTDGIYQPNVINYFSVNLSVLNCSKEFYQYNKNIQKASESAGNPFAEPVLVFTNINNGFGCFGSYVGNFRTQRVR